MNKTIAFLILLLAAPGTLLAQQTPSSVQLANTKATLVTEQSAIIPGKDIHAAIILEPKEGWHTYWENPGDAGMPTSLTWTLPEGYSASAIDWPTPDALPEGPLLTYAYPHMVFLPVTITTPPLYATPGAPVPLKVKAEWLVCKDICVPESADLQLDLWQSDNAGLSPSAPLFEEHRQHRPIPVDLHGSFTSSDKQLTLSVPLSLFKDRTVKSATFFMREENIIRYAAPQTLSLTKKDLQLTLERADNPPGDTVSGLLAVTFADNTSASYNLAFIPGPVASDTLWFPLVLLLAILGGLILNLMPCVLPILSLKALAIAKKSGHRHEHIVSQGIAYTLGILVTFGLIAGILIALRQAGESVGWGYQMQSPAFVGFLIYLLFVVGLSLSGVFHLPVLLGSAGQDIANESSTRGSFFTGVLATAVATPCTAPFMASAVGAALTMPPLQSLLVFEALGFGLALPFLLISIFPALRRFLPKPGAWMDIFKQLLAFPMYASVIWLMWVLALQTGAGGMVMALSGMLLIVIVIWMKSLFEEGSRAYRFIALFLYALLFIGTLPQLSYMETSAISLHEQGIETVTYSKEKLEELRKAGTPVFIDATAAWCITCQVNARVALYTERTMKEFKDRGVTLMIADWTKRNDDITAFLAGFGYQGVPLCVFYPGKSGKPVVLPQILTEDIVINIIKGE